MEKPFICQRGVLRPVKNLSAEVARKIAAGEVIDRPNAVVRELIDNAIDAGSYAVTVEIEGGGIDSIIVSDDGIGLSKEDLEHCAKPHATSKIIHETDLLNLSTLGFRGEALASIAAVSRLDITSRRKEENHAWHLHAEVSRDYQLEPAILEKGTKVCSSGLFENFPARRLFLKRPASEGSLCRQTFIEKALPFPEIAFRLFMDNNQKIFFPPGQSLKERFTSALSLENEISLFSELSVKDPSARPQWSMNIVIGDTSVTRADKKQIHVYVNNRKISEYSLIQAVEYGCEGYFPNALHPVCCVFIEINPSLVDFNIHPAKREARFKDIGPIHHALSSTLRSFFRPNSPVMHYESPKEQDFFSKESSFSPQTVPSNSSFSYSSLKIKEYTHTAETSAYKSLPSEADSMKRFQTSGNTAADNQSFTYFGSYLSLFLLAEKNGKLYVIDQHAGHERVLFNKFIQNTGQKQDLLIPYIIKTSSNDEDSYLASISDELHKAGFAISQQKAGIWDIKSVNSQWEGNEQDLEKDLLEKRIAPQDIIRSLAASHACRTAVKDGTILDRETAVKLISDIFKLEDPHCPHGRPVWTVITREELFTRVKRS